MEPNQRAERLKNLPAAKRELLLQKLREDAVRSAGARSIPARPWGDGPTPLSFAQQRLWVLERLHPGTAAYNIPYTVRVAGQLDPGLLARSLGEIVRRHEVLRARFGESQGAPVQTIAPLEPVSLPSVDLSALPQGAAEAARLAREEARRPFDLARGPLLRFVLVRLAAAEHLALFTLHHIAADGWSMENLVRELSVLCAAFAAGGSSPLRELPIQYADYAAWQRERLRGGILEEHLSFWRRQLAGAPTLLELPADRPRPATQSFRGAVRPLALNGATAGALHQMGRNAGTTSFAVALAAFQALLARLSGQSDLLIGVPVANRTVPELEPLIGFFANILVIRMGMKDDPGFATLLQRTAVALLSAQDHQDLPFEKLVDEIKPVRSLSHAPVFQVVLTWQAAPAWLPESSGGALRLEPWSTGGATAKFDLDLTLAEEKGATHGLRGGIEYATDLFDATTIERWSGSYQRFLSAALAEPEVPIGALPLLSAEEAHQLLWEWGNPGQKGEEDGCLHQLFEAQADLRPDAVAAVCGEATLSYGELDRQADRLAHRLRTLGTAPGDRIGLCLERGLGIVLGILGILKAGGVYVPLDPLYPRERLSFLLEDAGIGTVVVDRTLPATLSGTGVQSVPLEEPAGEEGGRLWPVPADLPAYVIYTSGSTGRPKGVVVTHRNATRLFASTREWLDFGPGDVWTLFHSYAFDFSVWEIWGALLHGGRLVVVPYEVSRSPAAFHALLLREEATVVSQTPSAFRQLDQAGGETLGSLRCIVFGGEALEPRSLRPWLSRYAGRGPALINMYGITETTVHVTWRPLQHRDVERGGSAIGVPIPDLRVYVLDSAGRPSPLGVAGELSVGGAGVALGYLGRPGLTAERFRPDPFSAAIGERLYRTGDLVCWRATGELEYLGRIDQQVKIRGFRIELGEIEAVLAEHPSVRSAAVVARDETSGARRLVAYVVGREGGRGPGAAELRTFAADRLPDYMVPAAFVVLPELPLTAHGKLDRDALPAPGESRPILEREYAPPRTPDEEALCAVWARVLSIEEVGIHDSFFALGGDSILSLQVVALAAERRLGISLEDLFRHQTVAELAGAIGRSEDRSAGESRSAPFSLVSEEDRLRLPGGLEDAYPLSHLQAGMLYHMALTPEDPLYHNVDSWHVRARFEAAPLAEAVRRVVARHPILRTSFDLAGFSEPLQRVHREALLPIEVIDLRGVPSAAQEAAIDEHIAREKRRLFDFSQPPQLRFFIHLRTAETFQFTLTENHAIFDGWSLHSTLAEIGRLYFALLAGGDPAEEPPLPMAYRDFVERERQAVASTGSASFWASMLHDFPVLELPRWSVRSGLGAPRMRVVKTAIPADLFEGLKAFSRRAAVPLKSVLLAAHLEVLVFLAGRAEVGTGVMVNGRLEEPGGHDVRGLFLNTLPFRLEPGGASWQERVRRTFDREREILTHQRYPFAVLQRQWGERPLLDVIFNYVFFHVARDLVRSRDIELVGGKGVEGASFALSVHFLRNPSPQVARLDLHLEYDSHRFPEQWIAALSGHYLRVLESMAMGSGAVPEVLLDLSEGERHQLLREWNDTREAGGEGLSLVDLFVRQAERTPHAVAARHGEQQITYGELLQRSCRLARRLRALGAGPEERVAVCLGRSLHMLIGIFGVLASGSSYVPLDPEHPEERLALVLDDCAPRLLLTERGALARLPPPACRVVEIDQEAEEPAAGGERPWNGLLPGHPAYVLYTSGSTGRPKGVQVSHSALVSFLEAMRRRPGLRATDVLVAVTTLAFDIAGLELFLPLVTGACVQVASRHIAVDGERLALALAESGATVMQATPATWRTLLEAGWTGSKHLRILCGGETLPRDLAERLVACCAEVWNVYGPTETTIWSAAGILRAAPGSVSIGRPIGNTRILVLSDRLAPVPSGGVGELWIGGAGLARGYLGRPDLTAERFLPDPHGAVEEPGARLYRTGDLTRRLPDGELEVLGRVDQQVKVRGFRIEPEEIEAALDRHPAVRQSVVLTRQAGPGDVRLVAWVVAERGEAPGFAELRGYLARQLPAYMVPSAFGFLDKLPLSPSGKVDRRTLSRMPLPAGEPSTERWDGAPRSPIEEALAGIWAEVLGRERIGIRESFFDLGGHSLLATQAVSRIYRLFGIEVPLRSLFERPTIAALSEVVEAKLSAGRATAPPAIEPVPRDQDLPLSFAQQRLWFLDRLEPDSSAYNISTTLRLVGSMSWQALSWSLSELVRRHEILRTRFIESGSEPRQRIDPPGDWLLPVVDLTALTEGCRQAIVGGIVRQEAGRAFDLAHERLFRPVLVRMGSEENLLLTTMHHIISDGWSTGILLREMGALYGAALQGKGSPLPELPVQYADFAVWQRHWLAGEILALELDFWRRQIGDLPPLLELPTDRPRPSVQSFRGGARETALGSRLTAGLKRLALETGATLFMVGLAGFSALLARLSGQSGFAIGTPIAGRNRTEVEGLVGLLANTLVLRADLRDEPTFAELVARIRTTALEAYAHQELPFEKLVAELAPVRSLAHAPLFQVMLVLQNIPSSSPLEMPGLALSSFPLPRTAARFDLTLELMETPGDLVATLEHNRDLFDPATALRFLVHLRTLLEAASRSPATPWSELPLLDASEMQQLLLEWNDTGDEIEEGRLFPDLFREQAARTPAAVAFELAGESISYGELQWRVARLAEHLRALGAGPEKRLAVCLERSLDMIVAVLAILDTGSAYVPLDPDFPRERLAFMLEDSGASVLLTQGSLRDRLPSTGIRVWQMGLPVDVPRDPGEAPACSRPSPGNLAYVIYTSGSTGRPKGVQVPHSALLRFLLAMRRRPGLSASDVLLAVTTLSFDIAGLELFLPLMVGARVRLVTREVAMDGRLLARELEVSGATVMQATPATWRMLLDAGWAGDGRLRLLCGGEAMSRDVADRLQACGMELWNVYGPTEATIWCSEARVTADAQVISIGRPITGTRIHLLSDSLQPLPAGAAGELWIGGASLARGYLGRPDLTAERFLPDPFGAIHRQPGARLYRTGDLAKQLPDGEIEVLGRLDQQIKLRGFRIELEEIEAALEAHAGIRQSAVLVHELVPGDRRLVAYLVPGEVGRPTGRDLRDFLAERLPAYMVPGTFVFLDALPLTPNGKVDRRGLSLLPLQPDSEEGEGVPRSPVEQALTTLLGEVLGQNRIGVHDSFFALGGHSLLATQVVSRIRRVFGVEVALRHIFEKPTVAELARLVEAELSAGRSVEPPSLSPIPRGQGLPLSFAQQRLWFLDQIEPGSPAYNISTVLCLTGSFDAAVLAQSLRELTRRHESLRTRFSGLDGEPVQWIDPPAPQELPLLDVSGLEAEQRRGVIGTIVREEGSRAFDLTRGGLFRTVLVRLAPCEHLLLTSLHHIVCDGWSLGILLRELAVLYGAFRRGEDSPLRDLPIQYADFAVWQRGWLSGDVLAAELSFWRERLDGLPALLELPTDRPRPAIQSLRGGIQESTLGSALTASLRRLGQEAGATLFMVTLTGFVSLLARLSGQDDLAVGTPIAARNRTEVEGLVGLLANTLVLRADVRGEPSFADLLARVRAATLEAYAHQELPFEKLVAGLAPERSLAHTPLFQVMLVLQNAPSAGRLDLPDLALSSFPMPRSTARFDLTLELVETPLDLWATLEHSRDLFDPLSALRLLGQLGALLESAVRDPAAPLTSLTLLRAVERHQLLVEWNGPARTYPGEALLHRRIEMQARCSPEAVAVQYEGESLTYADLDNRADRLARHLRKHGVGPDVPVGICAERSMELVIGLLAILKAGGAYVPLDPSYPLERLEFMIQDALAQVASPVLLVQEGTANLFGISPLSGARVIRLDSVGEDAAGDDESVLPDPSPDHPAYVIYTSGSTGRPKGVINTHRAICNRLLWMQEAYGLESTDAVLQKTPLSFDVSVWELFWPLITGARLVLARPEGHRDPFYLVSLIASREITTLHFVPSMLRAFLDLPDLARCSSLRRVVASGEALPPDLVHLFADRLGAVAKLHNLYGPTEAAVDVSFHPCGGDDVETVPIGRPIANIALVLLDRAGQPVPLGASGELCIGGAGLARGYHGRPDLTAAKFVPHTWSTSGGERLYRTGDLARWAPRGEIEYLGRLDHQVKIRGFRIELGEIEAALRAHPAVREAVVLAHQREDGHRRLVAYIVSAGAGVAAGELRAFLSRTLPDHMVPALLVFLPELPLAPNGKVNRRKLPDPGERAAVAEGSGAPATPAEIALAEVWQAVLGLERIEREDNFFSLGGDSLLSLKVIAQARHRGMDLSLQQIFRHQTVRALAATLEEPGRFLGASRRRSSSFALVSTEDRDRFPEGVEDAYPLARLQAGMLFHSELNPESAVYHDISTTHLLATFDAGRLSWAVARVIAAHPVLRTAFDLTSYREPLQLVHGQVEPDLVIEDLRHLGRDQQRRHLQVWMEGEKRSPFDWRHPPLFRIRVHLRSDESFQFSLSFHHSILDGWSVATLLTELFRLYLGGEEAEITPPASTYRDFLVCELEALRSVESRAYWTGILKGAEVSRLPRWRQTVRKSGSGPKSFHRLTLPLAVTGRLQELARSAGVPVKSVLLAVHCQVLSLLTGRTEALTGLVVNGRPEEDGGERVLGLFLNTLPYRLDLRSGSWRDLVHRAFEAERAMLPHRLYPMAELRREAGGQPLFEPVFNFIHFHVYRGLAGLGEVRALDSEFFEETDFVFQASFVLDSFGSELQVRLEHDADDLPAAEVAWIAGYYRATLAAVAESPEQIPAETPWWSDAERQQLVREWNDTAGDLDGPLLLHRLIEAQAERTPDSLAVRFEAASLSYRELDRRSGRLARRLRSLGSGPEVIVAVAMERSLELVVGLLAVLKSGAAYAPLDPDYPRERLAFMLSDALRGQPVRVLLTQSRWADLFPKDGGIAGVLTVLALDTPDDGSWTEASGWELTGEPAPDGLAYVIYTSGSTGRPKGAMNTHQAICNRLAWMQEAYRLAAGDRVLQKTPLSFDVSVWELFWPLTTGAALILAHPGGHRDTFYLASLIAEQEITTLHFVPSMLQVFVEERDAPECPSLRRVFASGEVLPRDLVRRFYERFGGGGLLPALHNLYGPTEAAVDVTFHACDPQSSEPAVPIGRPITNLEIHLMDPQGHAAPVGVPGELHIGGLGLARGYWMRPDLTAEKLVPHPLSDCRGERLYRTGDLACWLPNGEIEFLGRLDHQVKIRGFRIELGEIEAVLAGHPAVREVAVLAREVRPGDQRLVAYVAMAIAGGGMDRSELLAYARARLPEHMVPSFLVPVTAMPLLPNGKLDRAALPEPEALSMSPYSSPLGAVEEAVAALWGDLLGVARVGRQDNFFDLGGHSLLMLQLRARLRQQFEQDVSMVEMFRYPTVSAMAERLAFPRRKAAGSDRGVEVEQGKERLRQRLRQRQT